MRIKQRRAELHAAIGVFARETAFAQAALPTIPIGIVLRSGHCEPDGIVSPLRAMIRPPRLGSPRRPFMTVRIPDRSSTSTPHSSWAEEVKPSLRTSDASLRKPIDAGVACRGTSADLVFDQAVSKLPSDRCAPCEHAKDVLPMGREGGTRWMLPRAIVSYDSRGVIVSVLCADCMKALELDGCN
jgi:hypothetical protein